LFPERLEDYLSEDNPVRAIDVFVDELDLAGLGFGGGKRSTMPTRRKGLRSNRPLYRTTF
jgi:hypothetical protein